MPHGLACPAFRCRHERPLTGHRADRRLLAESRQRRFELGRRKPAIRLTAGREISTAPSAAANGRSKSLGSAQTRPRREAAARGWRRFAPIPLAAAGSVRSLRAVKPLSRHKRCPRCAGPPIYSTVGLTALHSFSLLASNVGKAMCRWAADAGAWMASSATRSSPTSTTCSIPLVTAV